VGSLRVEVTDNGAGISAENASKVFGEFSQIDKNKQQGGGGSGLGLWICRHIIRLHGGSLNFTSAGIGRGSTFYFCIPLFEPLEEKYSSLRIALDNLPMHSRHHRTRVHAEPCNENSVNSVRAARSARSADGAMMMIMPLKRKPIQRSSDDESSLRDEEIGQTRFQADVIAAVDGAAAGENLSKSDSLQHKLKILIVDDALSNRKITCKIIQNEVHPSHELCEADDGDVAVQMVKQSMDEGRPFDLVITDYYMNRMHEMNSDFVALLLD